MATVSGGNRLQVVLNGIAQKVASGSLVKVGFLENATYPDGKPVAMIAAINEFGSPSRSIPPRPFFRQAIASRSSEWPGAVAKLLKANDYDSTKTLAQAGEAIKGQIQQSITEFSGVPLAAATIKSKGFDKQLVNTGHMLQSVDYSVEK